MSKTLIGTQDTDDNGHARIDFDIDFDDDFTIEAEYTDQEAGINVSDSQTVENITYNLTLEVEEAEIDTGESLEISGELTSSDGTVITNERINIIVRGKNQRISTIMVENGVYEASMDNLRDGEYRIYASWKYNRVISDTINITVGTPQLTLTGEKQYINTSVEPNSLILTGYYGVGAIPMVGQEIKIYDGSTLIDTVITNENGGFEVPLSDIDDYMHLYKATCGENESEIFEVYIGYGDEVVIETTSNTITFGYSEDYPWMDTSGEDVTIYFGDGATETVTDPVGKLTHTFNDNKQKHMIVLFSLNYGIESLGYEFLRGNTGVTKVITGANPYSIGYKAFYGCTGLESIFIPYTLNDEIGDSAFEGCTSLQTVIIEGNMSDFGYKVFYGCTSINEYKLFWRGAENIIPYHPNTFQTNLLTKFIVPAGQKNNYIAKEYPADRIEEGKIELTITADKTEYNMDEDVIVTVTLKENGLPLTWTDISAKIINDIGGSTATRTWHTNRNGQVIKRISDSTTLNGGDIDIIVTYENITNVLNIDGYIYKNSLQQQDPGNWILRGSATISYDENGLELLGGNDGALILNKKLLKYSYKNIAIEYDLIYSRDGYSYLNYFFDENLEDKIFQLAKKPYGTKGTILDEYPNSDNWINTIMQNNDHVKIRIANDGVYANEAKVELFVNGYLILTKNNYPMSNFQDKLFSFATVQGSNATYKNLKIAYEEDYDINLSADKTIIESGETATITATIGNPAVKPNKKIHYEVKNGTTLMYEGDVISDNNGQASITYTGTGAGDIDIIFTYFDIERKIRIEDSASKTQTIITLISPAEGGSYYSDETIYIDGALTDKNGNPLANKQIKIENYEVL